MRGRLRSVYRFARCIWRPRVLVLMYHSVSPPGRTNPFTTVSPERFEEQMAFLAQSGMAISVDEFLSYQRSQRLPPGGRVLVTMDDAEVDILTYAAPILRRYGVPATIFVPTGTVGKPHGFWWWHRFQFLATALSQRGGSLDAWLMNQRPELVGPQPDPALDMWKRFRLLSESERDDLLSRASREYGNPELPQITRPMNWDELAELTRDGLITLGAHTVTHAMMAQLTEDELTWELRTSREQLSSLPGYRDVFAYPYGDPAVVTDRTVAAVRTAGFAAAFINSPGAIGVTSDRLTLPRVGPDDIGAAQFRWLIDCGLCLNPRTS